MWSWMKMLNSVIYLDWQCVRFFKKLKALSGVFFTTDQPHTHPYTHTHTHTQPTTNVFFIYRAENWANIFSICDFLKDHSTSATKTKPNPVSKTAIEFSLVHLYDTTSKPLSARPTVKRVFPYHQQLKRLLWPFKISWPSSISRDSLTGIFQKRPIINRLSR